MAEKIVTPKATLNYPALFAPKLNDKGEEVYSCCLVFNSDTDLGPLTEAAHAVGREKFNDWDKGFKAKKYHWPFRADGESKGYPPGSIFINVRSTFKPGVVDRFKDAETGKPVKIHGDQAQLVYAGCQVRAQLSPFAFDSNGKKGVSFGLVNLQKLGEGPRLDGRVAPEDAFEALEDPETDEIPF